MDFPWLPEAEGTRMPGASLGTAALILLVSVLSGRKVAGLLAILGAALALFGPRLGVVIPAITDRLDATAQARALGVLLLIAGFLVPRRRPSS